MERLKKMLGRFSFIRTGYKWYKTTRNRIEAFVVRNITRKYITEEYLKETFPRLGLNPGDRVIVHTSMSAMGILKNGPATFVKAIREYIGPEGLIVMPTYPHRDMLGYLENYSEKFDVRKSPSLNGAITEYFRRSEGAVRSLHPTHSLTAWGKDARKFMEGHEKSSSPYDENTPYKKIIDANIKVLLVGVNFDHMSVIRCIDDLVEDYPLNPYIRNKIYTVEMIDYEGKTIQISTPCHDPQYRRHNMAIFPYLKDKIQFGRIGKAKTMTLYSQDVINTQKKLAREGIFPFYNPPFKEGIPDK